MKLRLTKSTIALACVGIVAGAGVFANGKRAHQTSYLTVTYTAMLPSEREMYASLLKQAGDYQKKANALHDQAQSIRDSEGKKAGAAAIGDGISTMSVLSKGGTEFNPIHPTTPAGIIAFTGLKYWLSTSYVKSRPPEEQDKARRMASASWGGAAIGNFAALAGAAPQLSIPIALASIFGLYKHSSQKIEEIERLEAQASQLERQGASIMYAANNFKVQALARAKVREEAILAENKRMEALQDVVTASLSTPENPARTKTADVFTTPVIARAQQIFSGKSIDVIDDTADVIALDEPPRTRNRPVLQPVSLPPAQPSDLTPAPTLRNEDTYRRAFENQRSQVPFEAPASDPGLKPLQAFVLASTR